MPFLPVRQQVALKIEGTEGTDATPSSSDIITPAFDIKYTSEIEQNARKDIKANMSKDKTIHGKRAANVDFATEVRGSGTAGTAPSNLSAALRACGFSETIVAVTSVTYKPASASVSSATVSVYEGDNTTNFKLKKIVGARGNVKFEFKDGQVAMAMFSFKGRYVEPSDTTALTDAVISPQPVAVLGVSLSFQGIGTLLADSISIDMGNNLSQRVDINQASGVFSYVITDRKPSGKIDPEQTLTSVINFYNNLTSDTTGVLSFVLGGSAGNILTFNAPATQIENLSEAERNQLRTEDLTLKFCRNSAGGDDELSLAFT